MSQALQFSPTRPLQTPGPLLVVHPVTPHYMLNARQKVRTYAHGWLPMHGTPDVALHSAASIQAAGCHTRMHRKDAFVSPSCPGSRP